MCAALFLQCEQEQGPSPLLVDIPAGQGHELLSEYNFFTGTLADLEPNEGVLPYDLNTALFSDYALKKRFIYVPNGQQIPFDAENTLELPVGSVLIKHFYYPGDVYIETRLLIRGETGWRPETYIWDEDRSEARRTVIGGSREMSVNVDGQLQVFNYSIPNQNQCKNCHAFNGQINPIGPVVPNLNKDYSYSDGTANQIDKWIEAGILQGHGSSAVPEWPKLEDESASLNDRARAYLAVNCSSCHRLEGSAANSGLYLEYDNMDSLSAGFYKTPVAAGTGSGGFQYVIDPGNAEESILYYRMNTSDVEARMPELGRELIHMEGVELIREWIDSME